MIKELYVPGVGQLIRCSKITVITGFNTFILPQIAKYIRNVTDINLSPMNIANLDDYADISGLSFGMKLYKRQLKILARAKGKTAFVEYPETGLHPAEQTGMMTCLTHHANDNIDQLFILTHSDHVLNALRVLIAEGKVDRYDVVITWLQCVNKLKYNRVTIEIDNRGEFSEYPKDFFDEYNNQLMKLI